MVYIYEKSPTLKTLNEFNFQWSFYWKWHSTQFPWNEGSYVMVLILVTEVAKFPKLFSELTPKVSNLM